MPYSQPDDDGRTPDDASGTPRLESVLVPHADGPDELTVYPTDVPEERVTTTWLTAQEGAYVDLEEWR